MDASQDSVLSPHPVSISATSILFWQIVYYIVERILRQIHQAKLPKFHAQLLSSRKDLPYFGIALGFLITLFSSPLCIYAAWETIYTGETSSTGQLASGICLTSRTVLWISELNRLGENIFYCLHHLFSLSGALYLISRPVSRAVLGVYLTIFASLSSELIGDTLWISAAHGVTTKSSPLLRGFERINLLQFAFCRMPTIAYAFYVLCTSFRATASLMELLVGSALVAGYWSFVTFLIYKLALKIGIFRTLAVHRSSVHPARLRFGRSVIFTLYGVLMGFGLAALSGIALLFYAAAVPNAQASADAVPSSVPEALSLVVLYAVLGARLLSATFEDGPRRIMAKPIDSLLRPGFWLHGGVLGAGLAVYVSSSEIPYPNLLVSALGISLPLYEFFSRLGCESFGCCFGRELTPEEVDAGWKSRPWLWRIVPVRPVAYTSAQAMLLRQKPQLKGKMLVPVQRISAMLYLCQFLVVVGIVWMRWSSVLVAGRASFAAHAVIRLATEILRDDFRGEVKLSQDETRWRPTVTGVFAGIQLLGGIAATAAGIGSETFVTDKNWWNRVPEGGMARCLGLAFMVGFVAYGYNFREVGRWV